MADNPEELNEFVQELDKITEGRVPPIVREDDDPVDMDTDYDFDLDDEEDDDNGEEEFGGEESNVEPVVDQLAKVADEVASEVQTPDGTEFELSAEEAQSILNVAKDESRSPEVRQKISQALQTSDGFQQIVDTIRG